jgi:hypothetical protein
MRVVFKFAASVLLLVFATGTAMAAVPCQAKQLSSMGCGSDCPMMGMMHQAAEQSSADVRGASCCQISCLPTAPAPVQMLPEQFAPIAIIASECEAAIIPFTHKLQSKISTHELRKNPSALALLCTFLI